MARLPRGDRPGEIHHLYPRGVNRCAIFLDDRDRFFFMKSLVRACRCFHMSVLGYVLMSNHVHLVMRRGDVELGRAMKSLLGRYAQYFNRRYGRVGHLFQNRYGSSLVDTDAYLVHLIRYVHANPVRAGMVNSPDEYPHSSHLWYAQGRWPRWADPRTTAPLFGSTTARARFFSAADESADRRELVAHAERVSTKTLPSCDGGPRKGVSPARDSETPRDEAEQLVAMLALRKAVECSRGLEAGSITQKSSRREVAAARREFAAVSVLLAQIPAARVARFLGVTHGRVSQYIHKQRSD